MSNGEQIHSGATCKHFLQVAFGEHRGIAALEKISETSKDQSKRGKNGK
jgi:hypothetical protein